MTSIGKRMARVGRLALENGDAVKLESGCWVGRRRCRRRLEEPGRGNIAVDRTRRSRGILIFS